MSGEMVALRAAILESHPDSVYAAWLAVRQLAGREADPGTAAVLEAVSAVLNAAYAERERAA